MLQRHLRSNCNFVVLRRLTVSAYVARCKLFGHERSRANVDPHVERVEFKLGDVVCEAGGVLNHAYFPDGAVLSLLTVLENGTAIETANIGREGAFGLFAAMYSHTSFNRSVVQLQGGLLRVPIKILQ